MLPTFSINENPLDKSKLKKIGKIVTSLEDNPSDEVREWAGEAYIKAVTKESVGNMNVSGYANSCQKNTKLTKLNNSKNELTILSQEEIDKGYVGVTDLVADYVEDNLDEIIDNLDMDFYVDSFMKMREYILFKKGHDIWRLIELSKLDDKQAQNRLRIIMDECGIRELLYYVLTKSACYNKLEGMLC